MADILVLYYSHTGSVRELATHIARGVESVSGMTAPDNGPPYVSNADLRECAGLALGSPTRFGNMAAPIKYFLDGTGGEWMSGALAGKPASVFTSTSTMHGGNEATLLSMMIPLLHHGMVIVGLPFTEADLSTTQQGGTPYGASHVGGSDGALPVSNAEKQLAYAAGRRLATIAAKLAA